MTEVLTEDQARRAAAVRVAREVLNRQPAYGTMAALVAQPAPDYWALIAVAHYIITGAEIPTEDDDDDDTEDAVIVDEVQDWVRDSTRPNVSYGPAADDAPTTLNTPEGSVDLTTGEAA